MSIKGVQCVEMVGKRCRKESVGAFEKWRSREKVWEKLEEGGGYQLHYEVAWFRSGGNQKHVGVLEGWQGEG